MRERIITYGILLILVLGTGFLLNQLKTNPKASVNASTVQSAVTSVKVGKQSYAVELALTVDQQALGLGQRDLLAPDTGMLFVFKPAEVATFWMKEMHFPLDIIWIYQGKIVAIDRNVPVPAENAQPADLPTYSPKTLVDYVLEINANASAGLNVGDSFELSSSQGV